LNTRFSTLSRPLQGIAFIVVAVACFAALDAASKAVSTAVPLVMAIWFRYLFQAPATALAMLPTRGRSLLRTRHPGLQFARGALLAASSALAFLSLRYMPVGEFTAIVMLTPLVITLLAATQLGERVSPLRWACMLGGFAGALLVIQPGSDMFDWTLLMPLAIVATNTAFQVLTSRLAKVEDAATMHFYTGCVGAGLATAALPFAWAELGASLWVGLLLMGVFSTLGHFLLILAYSRAPVAVLTPYLYLQIGFAMLAGWVVFSHVPDRWAVAGIAAIAVCGALGTWLTARESRTA
jgi:drug/metabolite transporter (DMT)-like permease